MSFYIFPLIGFMLCAKVQRISATSVTKLLKDVNKTEKPEPHFPACIKKATPIEL